VMQAMGEHVDVRLRAPHQLAVEPDHAFHLIEGHRHWSFLRWRAPCRGARCFASRFESRYGDGSMRAPLRAGCDDRRIRAARHVPFAQHQHLVTKPKNMSTWLT